MLKNWWRTMAKLTKLKFWKILAASEVVVLPSFISIDMKTLKLPLNQFITSNSRIMLNLFKLVLPV